VHLVAVQYRSFRNTDPPHLVEIWNETFTSRSIARLRHSSVFERHIVSKPYFDPKGLIIAEEDGRRIGFAHAGFGPNQRETLVGRHQGVLCVLAVRPGQQKKGVGSELLQRSEAYLRDHGALTWFAGQKKPVAPFYFGIWGGSDLPGILNSEPNAAPFFEKHGYRPWETTLILQRFLDKPVNVADGRFPALRRRFESRILPRIPLGTWWQECVIGLVEPVEFRLEEKLTGKLAARAVAWEMEAFSWTWNVPAVGLIDFQVREELRRQGLGKFLFTQILRYLQEQYFGVAEMQCLDTNQAAANLCRSVGFEQIDVGRTYRKS
jgi:ribosomal protein S18 acetylase RimI-like enzyme